MYVIFITYILYEEVSFMSYRQTYGMRMACWEDEKDRHDWVAAFNRAVESRDYKLVEELISDGIENGYTFPSVTDSTIMKLFKKHHISD